MERTYIMLKPDAVERGLVGEIITRIEKKGDFKITSLKLMTLSEDVIKEHYVHLLDKPFFGEISDYMTRGPVVGMIVEGEDAVTIMRSMMGPTNWKEANPGTIRGDFASSMTENLIHGSDSADNAEIEIKRFFG